MKKFSIGALLILGLASVSQAQISRTFVGVNGNDANDCLAPGTACRTLNGAIGKVDAGGEVIVIETGSYAGATITKSVKINVPSGAVAFSALSLTITAGVNDVIVVRGMTMKALNPGSSTAINITSAGSVLIENCVIDGWATGVAVATGARVDIKDTTMRGNLTGVSVTNANARVSADQVRAIRNGTAFNVTAGSLATIGRSLLAGNTTGANASGAGSAVTISRSQISGQTGDGVLVGAGAFGRVTDSIVSGNGVGLNNAGTLTSLGNNAVSGNTTNTSGTITAGALQ